MKELKPKLILPNGDSRRGSSFKQFLIIIIVFVIGVFVGINISGMREIDDSNGVTVVDERSGEKKINKGTDEEGPGISKESSASLENDYSKVNDGGSFELSSEGKENVQDLEKYQATEHKGFIIQKGDYTVQVGAFKEIERANKAQSELKSRGYDPYVIPYVNSLGETWFLVRIGKFDSRERAEDYAISYQRNEGMDAFVEELVQ